MAGVESQPGAWQGSAAACKLHCSWSWPCSCSVLVKPQGSMSPLENPHLQGRAFDTRTPDLIQLPVPPYSWG